MYAYCLQCQPQRSKAIAEYLQRTGAVDRAFSPSVIQHHRKQGQNVKESYDLLTGYLFLYAERRLQSLRPVLDVIGAIRLLRYQDQYELRGSDYDFAMDLYGRNGIVNVMKLIKAGDQIRLSDPLFDTLQGKVAEVDYRKQRAKILYQFAFNEVAVWVAFDEVIRCEASDAEETGASRQAHGPGPEQGSRQ